MTNKFDKGDIVYSIDVNPYLIVNINKKIVSDYFHNNLPDINTYIYSCIGLGNTIIKDYEISEEQKNIINSVFTNSPFEKNPGKTISSSSSESYLFFKEELEIAIKRLVEERKIQNENQISAVEKFRCPLTGKKIITQKHDGFTLDGPTYYKVEDSEIIWESYPRDWKYKVYHTKYNDKKYSFEYIGNGIWKELQLIEGDTGKGIYVDKFLYSFGDKDVLKEVKEFLETQQIEHQKWLNELKAKKNDLVFFPNIMPVSATTIKTEMLSVKPLESPTGLLHYLEMPKKDKVIINIENEGQFEIDKDVLKGWNCKEIDLNLFEFGKTKFSIEKEL